MDSNVVIATTTFYRSTSDLRFHLACQMVSKAAQEGYTVVIVDGSPEKLVASTFRDLGALVFPQQEAGMLASRQEVFRLAGEELGKKATAERKVILWTEPEKEDIIRWVRKITDPICLGTADIVIPTRTATSLGTYPKFQADEETTANTVYQRASGINADPMFGPVALVAELVDLFATCNPADYGVADSYMQHAAPLVAASKGWRVSTCEVDFVYPAAQRAEEDKGGALFETMVEKRLWQCSQLVDMYFRLAELLKLGIYSR